MKLRLLFPVFLLAALLACSKKEDAPSPRIDLSLEFATADPGAESVDAAKLEAAFTKARSVTNLLSLVVVRNGKIVGEEYFNGNTPDSLNHLRSSTKSVIGLLTGIAIHEGKIGSVNQQLSEFIPAGTYDFTGQKAGITLEHLLTMSSGIQWNENTAAGYNEWILSGDHLMHVLQKPMAAEPGQTFNYNSGAVHLLSVAITNATGMSTSDFAAASLFTHLGITRWRWEVLSGPYFNGGAGITLRPRDMAKIGQLILQDGYSGQEEIVPASWLLASTRQHQSAGYGTGTLTGLKYGYLWWLGEHQGDEVILAWGHGGQFIFCLPAKQLVIVTTARFQGLGNSAPSQTANIMDLLTGFVLPAVQ